MIFNWEFYINKYEDLKKLLINEDDAFNHWIKHGKVEQRIYNDIPIFFNWKNYIEINKDLTHIRNEDDAWKHFLYHGNKENRNIKHKKIMQIYCL